ncbi:MAG: 50S ribosomal protein L30 [Bacteriovoracaceae bacterium]|jgi:large subunit ribosomal protein L30|nr:50S ribosomal protein L30 [Halobacteriovoraceae bacterium]MDP7321738.1 50S ribosomal protein L30 [Bacteriovoracaceae bacterium]|tara:strand:- start:856 stop:1038 length:183 start_codon:yes stop_codon:yes gene_type:complete
MGTITVRLKKSPVSCTEKMKANVRGLGLRKIGSTKKLENTPCVRGMIKKVIHLVEIVEEK